VNVPTEDPTFLYQDFAVGLQPDKQVNNGQPSLHVRCLAALQIKPGEKVVHVGAGTGYYTALLATLAGPNGSIIAYEIDEDLAGKAKANLESYRNVTVQNRSGAQGPLSECDVIYVNAGATGPMDAWLDALHPGGRVLFPLTTVHGAGAMLLVTRIANNFAAKFVVQAAFIHCVGVCDEEMGKKLLEAFKSGGLWNLGNKNGVWDVRSLRRNIQPDGTCWFAGQGWWLSTVAVT
jgi:protein-L-isoaspartate(D-aspartate) O-methyltransferase